MPHSDGASLYIRPFVFASDVGMGVHASRNYVFCIICAPSGAYYAEGINPVRIYVEDEYIRAAPGLTGFTKCGGNYAASIKAGEMAEEQGFAQVLWLGRRGEEVRGGSRLHEHHVQDRRQDLHPLPAPARCCPASPAAPSSSCCGTGAMRSARSMWPSPTS